MAWRSSFSVLLVAAASTTALAQDLPRQVAANENVRVVSPSGVTASYPSANSGALRGDITVPSGPGGGGGGFDGNFGVLAFDSAPLAFPNAVNLQPNGSTYAQNTAPVQAFASSAPNSGVDSAPPPIRPGYLAAPAFQWWTSTFNPCPWEYRRRLGCN